MKTLACDLCDKTHYLETNQPPDGWKKMSLNYRWKGNIGGDMFRFDLCPSCASKITYDGVRERALEFLKAIKITGVT